MTVYEKHIHNPPCMHRKPPCSNGLANTSFIELTLSMAFGESFRQILTQENNRCVKLCVYIVIYMQVISLFLNWAMSSPRRTRTFFFKYAQEKG